MTTTTHITHEQLASLRNECYDADAIALRDHGAWLTYDEAEELGDRARDWARRRLGLVWDTTSADRVVLLPADAEVES